MLCIAVETMAMLKTSGSVGFGVLFGTLGARYKHGIPATPRGGPVLVNDSQWTYHHVRP